MKKIIRNSIFVCMIFLAAVKSHAEEKKIKWNFKQVDLLEMIEIYSKATGAQFIVDTTVRGKISNFTQTEITKDEAFNFLSRSMTINGFSWVKINDKYVVRNARSAQRDGIPVYSELPASEPEHMATYMYKLKNATCDDIKSRLGRILNSSYGEIECEPDSNNLIITDFTTALHRINTIIEKVDVAAAKAPTKK